MSQKCKTMEFAQRIEEWKRKKAKLKVIDELISYVGYEYQKLGGEIFSDYLFAQDSPTIENLLSFLDHLSDNNVKQDVTPRIYLLIAHADFIKELRDVKEELTQIVSDLEPETHKESPVPTVNS